MARADSMREGVVNSDGISVSKEALEECMRHSLRIAKSRKLESI